MKTKLPEKIETVEQAKAFLTDLYNNKEQFHPEDDAHDIVWDMLKEQHPTKEEADKLNQLMENIYDLPGNDGRHCGEMVFDPCEWLLMLDPEYRKRLEEDDKED